MTINGIYIEDDSQTMTLKSNPTVTKAAPVKDLNAPAPVVPYMDHYSDHPTTGLTPQRLRTILRDAEQGQQKAIVELYDDILERDAIISGAFDVRKLAVTKNEFEFLPREGTGSKGKKQADFLMEVARNLSADQLQYSYDADNLDFDAMLSDALDAIPKGIAIPELTWSQDGSEWLITSCKHVSQKHLVYGHPSELPWNPYQIRIRTWDIDDPGNQEQNQLTYGIPLPPFRYLLHQYRAFSGYPSRAGLLRTVAWPYLLKWFGMEGAAMFVELYGMPFVKGTYDPNTPTDLAVLRKAVKNMGRDNRIVVSNDMDVSLMGTEKGQDLIHKDFVEMMDAQSLIAILGQSGTTMSTPGKLGEEKEKGDVRQDIMEADAKSLEKCVQLRFVQPQCMFNYGECLVDFRIKYQSVEDQNTKSKRYVDLGGLLPIPLQHMYDEFNIPVPKDGEPCTTIQNAAPLGGGNPVPFKRLVGSASSRRAKRQAATIAASNAITGVIDSAASQSVKAYEALLEGTDEITDPKKFEKALRKNLSKFYEAFQPVVDTAIDKAYDVAINTMGIKPKAAKMTRDMFERMIVCAGDGPNVKFKFNAKNSTAQDFLKFQKMFITQVEGEQITSKLVDYANVNLTKSLDDGMTRADFRNELIEANGIGSIKPWHATLVFTNNVATAHAASKLYAMNDNKKFFPCWEFMAILDASTTPECEELNGKVFANTDTSYWPPLHHGCRSEPSPIDQLEQTDEQYTVEKSSEVDVEQDSNWKNGAVENYSNWVGSMVKEYPSLKDTINNYED